jgi:hypothetical protein
MNLHAFGSSIPVAVIAAVGIVLAIVDTALA